MTDGTKWWRWGLRFSYDLAMDLVQKDLASLAATMCFYAFFSLFPLLLLLMYALSFLAPNATVERVLLLAVRPYFPALPEAKTFITDNITRLAGMGGKVSVLSALTLLWSATSAFIAVQQALDIIFEVKIPRSYIARRFISFGMVVLLVVITLLSSFVVALYPLWSQHGFALPSWVPIFPVLNHLSQVFFPVSLFFTCLLLYHILPSNVSPSRNLLIGAFIASLLLDIARQVFVWYAIHLVRYELIYGTLAVVMLILLWMYVASILVLLGAAVAHRLNAQSMG